MIIRLDMLTEIKEDIEKVIFNHCINEGNIINHKISQFIFFKSKVGYGLTFFSNKLRKFINFTNIYLL